MSDESSNAGINRSVIESSTHASSTQRKWFTKKKFYIPTAVVVVVALAGFVAWRYVVATPQYSLYMTYQAINQRDYDSFKKYVDMDSVIDSAIDKSMSESKTSDTTGFGAAFVAMLKPAFKEAANISVKKGVETGQFKSDFKQANVVGYATAKTKIDGKVATITLSKNGKTTSFEMRSKGGYWQIFQMDLDEKTLISDMDAVHTTVNAKFGQRESIGNGWFITVNEPSDYVPTDVYSRPDTGHKYLASQVVYENTTDKSDTYSTANL